jgi:hypothetical protein
MKMTTRSEIDILPPTGKASFMTASHRDRAVPVAFFPDMERVSATKLNLGICLADGSRAGLWTWLRMQSFGMEIP